MCGPPIVAQRGRVARAEVAADVVDAVGPSVLLVACHRAKEVLGQEAQLRMFFGHGRKVHRVGKFKEAAQWRGFGFDVGNLVCAVCDSGRPDVLRCEGG